MEIPTPQIATPPAVVPQPGIAMNGKDLNEIAERSYQLVRSRSEYTYLALEPWVVPWGNESLQVGYRRIDGASADMSGLLGRISTDGVNWGEPFQIEVPDIHISSPDSEEEFSGRWLPCSTVSVPCNPRVIGSDGWSPNLSHQDISEMFSDGEALHVISLRKIPGPRWHDRLYLSVTEDLVNRTTFESPPIAPGGNHEELYSTSQLGSIAFGPEGWLIPISTLTYVDAMAVVPEDVLSEVLEAGTDFTVEGSRDGISLFWNSEVRNSRTSYDNDRTISWDDLGIDYDLYEKYGSKTNKPYHYGERWEGAAWSASWGSDPVLTRLPDSSVGICCYVVGTETGFLAYSDPTEPGYVDSGSTEMFFSVDGIVWNSVSMPDPCIHVTTINGVNEGLLVRGRFQYPGCGVGNSGRIGDHVSWMSGQDGSHIRTLQFPASKGGTCCNIVITSAGYIGWSDAAYQQCGGGPVVPEIYFSSEGYSWQPLELPRSDIWISWVKVVDSGIELDAVIVPESYWTKEANNRECVPPGEMAVWEGEGDGTN